MVFFGVLRKRLRQEQKPLRFILSRILWRTGACRILMIKRKYYKLRFWPTSISAMLWVNQNARKDDESFLRRYLKESNTMVDVGANIGALSLTAAKTVGPNGKVFSIEAHPKTFKYLVKNIELNNINNIVTINSAVGERKQNVIFSDKHADDMNQIVQGDESQHSIAIKLDKLDDLIPSSVDFIDLLKIDVEGFEKFALIGASSIMQKCACIYYESSEINFNKYGYTTMDIIEMLKMAGYSIYKIHNEKLLKEIVQADYKSVVCENLMGIKDIVDFNYRTEWLVG